MSAETKKIRTLTRIVNPGYVPGGSAEAVFAAGAEVTVPATLADKWLADGSAEAIAETEEAKPAKADKPDKK